MKILCAQEHIQVALSKADRLTGSHTTLPVLAGVHLKAEKGRLVIRATNLDVGVEITVPAKVEKEGIVVVPSKVLYGVVSSLKGDTVSFEEEKGNVIVKTEKSKTLVKTLPSEEFPNLPRIEGKDSFTLKTESLAAGFRAVAYAASTSTVKPELASVLVYGEQDAIVFVATDSFRLAEKKIVVKGGKEFDKILIPSKNIVDMVRVFEDVEGELTVSFNENQISLEMDGVYLTSRLIDSTFPDYKQIIPKNSETTVVVLKSDLLDTLKKSHIFAGKFNQVNFNVDVGNKKFSVSSSSAEVGENTDTVDATIEGDSVDINFNYRYILESMQSFTTDSISLNLTGAGRPMVLKAIPEQGFLYLVMPMNR